MRGHVGDIRNPLGDIQSRYGNDIARKAGAITGNTRAEQEAVYRHTDDWEARYELMRILFQPTRNGGSA